MSDLHERVALVTGSSRGIGRAIALELARRGATVIINSSNDLDELGATYEELIRVSPRSMSLVADVASGAAVQQMVASVLGALGRIDILVNNAGIVQDQTVAKMSEDSWRRVLDVNLTGMFLCCKAVIGPMSQAGFGRIVNISSVIGQTGAFGQANYAAAKAGVLGLTRSLALELAKHGITVNAICPGFIDTSMMNDIPADRLDQLRARIPLRRLGKPEEIARLVRFVVEEADYLTGEAISINGGLAMS